MRRSIQVFENSGLLVETLAGECASLLAGGGTAVFGGGVIPFAVCGALANHANLYWRMIQVFPADEAFLPKGHPDRNETRLRQLLSRRPCLVQSFPTGLDPERAAREMQKYVRRVIPFNVVVLELGAGGRMGSLAPGSPVLESQELVDIQKGSGRNDPGRLVLTPTALSASEKVVLCATGPGVAETLRDLEEGAKLPPLILHPLQPVAIYADGEAAEGMIL
ncbi:MAG: 6-phosphogluconolactonase [Thermovirgaceae bacterium]